MRSSNAFTRQGSWCRFLGHLPHILPPRESVECRDLPPCSWNRKSKSKMRNTKGTECKMFKSHAHSSSDAGQQFQLRNKWTINQLKNPVNWAVSGFLLLSSQFFQSSPMCVCVRLFGYDSDYDSMSRLWLWHDSLLIITVWLIVHVYDYYDYYDS